MRIRVVESGEEADQRMADVLVDPRERRCLPTHSICSSFILQSVTVKAYRTRVPILLRHWSVLGSGGLKRDHVLHPREFRSGDIGP